MVNFAQLKTFVTVADCGSFSDAARVLGISQPSVTMQMQALEADCSAQLLDRAHRKVTLTEAGAALLVHARRILAEVDAARASLDALSATLSGSVTIAASTTPGQYLLPRLLGRFLAENPGVRIVLRVYDSAEVVAQLEAGEADIGMTGVEQRRGGVRFEPLGSDDLVLICPPGHPAAKAPVDSFADIAGEPFVMREEGSGTRAAAEKVIREAGVDPAGLRSVMQLGTNEALVSAVEGGVGLAIVSAHVARKAVELGSVQLVEGAGFPAQRPLFLALPSRAPSRAVAEMTRYLRAKLG